ncbi:tetratricopeptide repeat protein [Carboxylicivirga sp. RSCT41]|uniref:tetratricopeptide repeat protein n=1 Tax=Carboxylicivirga agarovorans TaxID=3417570 RepID=UPI003D337D67
MKFLISFIYLIFFIQLVNGQSVLDELKRAKNMQENKPDSCIFISQRILTQLKDEQKEERAYVFWNLAQAYLYKHKYHTALLYAHKAKEQYIESDTSILYQNILATTGWIFYDIGNYKHAEPFHQKALEVAQRRNDLPSEVVYTNALGLNALSVKQFQKALGQFQKALFLLSRPDADYPYLLSTIQNNMGIIYIEYEDWNKAETFLLDAVKNSSGDPSSMLETYSLLARVYLNTRQFQKCRQYLDDAEELSYLTTYSFSLSEYYKVRYEYEYLRGNVNAAYRYQSKYVQLFQKINNDDIQEVMNYMMNMQEEKIRQDEQLIKQARQLAFNRQILIYIGIVLTLIISGVFFYVLKSRAERSRLRQKLLSQELEKNAEEKAELSSELAHKKEAIETLALTMSKRNELVQQLADSIGKATSKEVKDSWRKFESAFNEYSFSNILSDEYISDLKLRLQQKYPSLTQKEILLIIDIRNNLSSKELADKYHVEVKSIEMSRYRLRKKLNVEKGVQLRDFIMKL